MRTMAKSDMIGLLRERFYCWNSLPSNDRKCKTLLLQQRKYRFLCPLTLKYVGDKLVTFAGSLIHIHYISSQVLMTDSVLIPNYFNASFLRHQKSRFLIK